MIHVKRCLRRTSDRALASKGVRCPDVSVLPRLPSRPVARSWSHRQHLPTLRSVRPSLRRKTLQQFTLEVQAEKEGARTTTVELSVPGGFNIESFADTPGWKRQVTSEGSCEEAHAQRVVWTGAEKSGRDDPVFHFTATLDSAKTYAVKVRQVYDDGSLVDWDGPADSEQPAAFVKGVSSIGGGGRTTLTIVALIVAGWES